MKTNYIKWRITRLSIRLKKLSESCDNLCSLTDQHILAVGVLVTAQEKVIKKLMRLQEKAGYPVTNSQLK